MNPVQAAHPLQGRQKGDAAADGPGAAERDVVDAGQGGQFVVAGGHQGLVGGDDVLAGPQGGGDKVKGRTDAAHRLDNQLHRRVREDRLHGGHAAGVQLRPGSAGQDVGHVPVRISLQQLPDAASDDAKAQQRDFHMEPPSLLCTVLFLMQRQMFLN